jgi:hypothetical protein
MNQQNQSSKLIRKKRRSGKKMTRQHPSKLLQNVAAIQRSNLSFKDFHIILYMHTYCSYCECVAISLSSQPDRTLSTLSYGLKTNCNLSQSHHGHMSITCTHTTGNSNTNLSQVSYIKLLRSQYKQGCNQCEHSYTPVYHHLNAHQLHINAPYKHLIVIFSTSPVGLTN